MQVRILKTIFSRDLEKLRKEIGAYQQEEKIWHIEKSITNSAGNLCLHIVGNLNTYIGAELGKTGYVRQRDLEFSLKDIFQKELLEKIDATIIVVDKTLEALTDIQLEDEYPLLVYAEKTTIGFLLVSLIAHLSYHLGQINYHRRLLDKVEL
jgi:uncharacterized damage-inducible protein DinB